jgi:hypothetical protein
VRSGIVDRVSKDLILLLAIGLVTEIAIAIACSRVAEARGFSTRKWAIIGFFTGIFGLMAVCLVKGPEAPDPTEPQSE